MLQECNIKSNINGNLSCTRGKNPDHIAKLFTAFHAEKPDSGLQMFLNLNITTEQSS